MTSTWNPEQYNRFRSERHQPFHDLLAMVQPRPQMRVVDLGCGTGELTRMLHDHLAAANTVGIDSSETMLAGSAAHAGGGLRFEHGDIESFAADGLYDLVFSNAALHWVAGHPALFARLRDALAPAGQLAVQMPYNFDHPSHRVAETVAGEAPFREALSGFTVQSPVLGPEAYATLLHRLGFHAQQVRMHVYAHVLPARDDVVEWVKGTLLTAYQRRLPEPLWPVFLARYREHLLPGLEPTSPYLFLFKRVLLWAQR